MADGAASARMIHSGNGSLPFEMNSWPKKTSRQVYDVAHPKKPSSEDLKYEILRRNPNVTCKHWDQKALTDKLRTMPPHVDGEVN